MAINENAPGTVHLMMGNEAIARGALEAGIGFAAAYPGTPSSEIIGTLAPLAKQLGIHVEWSTNEIIALEAAAGASTAGIRSLAAMKHNGVNVASDFLANLAQSTVNGGLLLIACDDPSAISSSNEQEIRHIAKWLDIPLLEPGDFQEAKEMTKWLFGLSERIGKCCILRGVTRISHARGNVTWGELPDVKQKARFNEICSLDNPKQTMFSPFPGAVTHAQTHAKLEEARREFEKSPFNKYQGPEDPELLIITCGSGSLYSGDAVNLLGLQSRVGVLKLGTLWPLPTDFITPHLKKAGKVLFIEEVDPFLEQGIMEYAARFGSSQILPAFYGKWTGHIDSFGDLNPDRVMKAIASILDIKIPARDAEYDARAKELAQKYVSERSLAFCPGCPHRATFWNTKNAIRLDGRDGFMTGDIGCYTLGLWPAGYYQLRTHYCMGGAVGVANGLGQLAPYGFDQPVLAVVGDSTFFHASIPAVLNAVYNKANFTLLVLDNGTTAMTSFQPHVGTGVTAAGDTSEPVTIEAMCQAMHVPYEVCDPFQFEETTKTMMDAMNRDGIKVLIMRRPCELQRARKARKPYKMKVDPAKCIGESCGCNRVCTRIFACPGLVWNKETGKSQIDEVICAGCGICSQVCPQGAIIKESL